MPDPLRLQTSVVKLILKKRLTFNQGMNYALAEAVRQSRGRWASCEGKLAALKGLPDRWLSWFEDLTKHHPAPEPTGALWFEFPSELNLAVSSVAGCASLDASAPSFGLEGGGHWPLDRKGLTLPRGLIELPELDDFFHLAGWRHDRFDDARYAMEPGYFAISGAAIVLLVLHGLPRTRFASHSRSSIGVFGGHAESAVVPLGTLTDRSWSPLRRRPSSVPKPEELDPRSMYFELPKYLAHGGDPNWRGPDGSTLLQHLRFRELKTIAAALRAGADPTVRLKGSLPTIFTFGASEIAILDALTDAGADPTQLNDHGQTLPEWMAGTASGSTSNLDWCLRHGVNHRAEGSGFYPLHDIAYWGPYDRGDLARRVAQLRWWMRRGFGINTLDEQQRTPLIWALIRHATELDDEILRRRRDRDFCHWYHQHDRVAQELLKLGADPNVGFPKARSFRVPEGGTPLMLRRYDTPQLARALLKHGADPTRRCVRGRTAIDYARYASKTPDRLGHESAAEVVKLLELAVKRWKKQRPDR